MEKLLDDLSERTNVAENVVKLLQRSFSEIESRQRNLDLARESVVERMMEIEFLRESYDKGLKDLEARESDFRAFREGKKRKLALEEEELGARREELLSGVRMKEEELDGQLTALRVQIQRLEAEQKSMQRKTCERLKEIKAQEASISLARQSLAERERKLQQIVGTLDDRICAVEERESELNRDVDRRMREVTLKEEQLSLKWQEFVKEVRLADEKFMEQETVKIGLCERLGLAENKVEGFMVKINERFKEMETRESVVWESVAESVKHADLIRELLEREVTEFEEMRRAFCSFQEEKMRELVLKEEQLNTMSRELAKDAELRNEQLTKQGRLGNQLLEKLELSQDKIEDFKEIVDEKLKETGSMDIELKELEMKDFGMMKREFMSFREDKMLGLVWMENQLNAMSEELVKDAKLRDEQLTDQEKLGNQLLERLESMHHKVEDLRNTLQDKMKEVSLKEMEVNSTCHWVEQKMDEVDSKRMKLREKKKSLLTEEEKLIHKKNKLRENHEELKMERKNLESWQRELEVKWGEVNSVRESNKNLSQVLDRREKVLDSVKQFIRNCFREHQTIKKKLLLEKDLVEKRARDLDLNDSADIKFILRMDGKTLQMFLNDPEKDLESMGDEVFKILHLSSDPAKLVLDAMVGFYPPHLRKGDVEVNVRRACIILLEQLFRMSKKIQPCTRKEAIDLASSWKSKIRANSENPLAVLGFLHLLAAYDVTSCFDRNEILSFLMMVDKHRQSPQLYRLLGFTEALQVMHLVTIAFCVKNKTC
ncbi:protein FRIGIDA [Striga asiatica]|uniref:FRIGIDA-like protein n=1 Tax=Striga asiatica TaxID=4170 RepID=A0A5A7NWP0_STRAF|nr:protein FRIGIDA [Striga asiatica]